MRVAVTGLGIVSCLGLSLEAVSRSLSEGRSGIDVDPDRIEMGFKSPLTGVIRGYDPRHYVNRKQIKTMGQPAQYAVGAAYEAIKDARLAPEDLAQVGVGIIVGNDSCAQPVVEAVDSVRSHKKTSLIGSGNIIQVMNSTVTMNLATVFGIRGAAWTVSAACASGAHALGQAYMLVKLGMQDMVLCGGAQEMNWPAMASFDALGAFARFEGAPGTAVRPFATNRTGLVPSGGAAMLVLERLDRAVERGAHVYGEVIGYAFSNDGIHLTQPMGDGASRAMREALRQAKIDAAAVDYINAHATGTPVGDLAEGKSILEVFGVKGPPVSSTKSMTGHECWMAGASEVLYSLLMMRDGFLAPNINLSELDPALAGLDVITGTRRQRPRVVLSNSFGFGGTNASLLLKAFEA
ncbi:MAG: beta-ketoacyl-[acyl-carrier-protein] synthase family protein [Deltaproteobacteria bacterium]|nr:beta-ketoacyl-[acyl-carrier-protein] synthase family protein [Deltaproteobacteria bacterium]